MKITPELLKKYASGHCTAEERRMVENWLPGSEDITTHVSEEEVGAETDRIWRSISDDIDRPRFVSFHKIFNRYVAAACIAFVLFGLYIYSLNINLSKDPLLASTEKAAYNPPARGFSIRYIDPKLKTELKADNDLEDILSSSAILLNKVKSKYKQVSVCKTFDDERGLQRIVIYGNHRPLIAFTELKPGQV